MYEDFHTMVMLSSPVKGQKALLVNTDDDGRAAIVARYLMRVRDAAREGAAEDEAVSINAVADYMEHKDWIRFKSAFVTIEQRYGRVDTVHVLTEDTKGLYIAVHRSAIFAVKTEVYEPGNHHD